MTRPQWKCDERRNARDYRNADDRKAYNAGYSDGFHNYPQWSGNDPGWHPKAYCAGYWEGVHDATPPDKRTLLIP